MQNPAAFLDYRLVLSHWCQQHPLGNQGTKPCALEVFLEWKSSQVVSFFTDAGYSGHETLVTATEWLKSSKLLSLEGKHIPSYMVSGSLGSQIISNVFCSEPAAQFACILATRLQGRKAAFKATLTSVCPSRLPVHTSSLLAKPECHEQPVGTLRG